jgi:hypothetical protein
MLLTVRFFNEIFLTGELIYRRIVWEDYRVLKVCNDMEGRRPDVLECRRISRDFS